MKRASLGVELARKNRLVVEVERTVEEEKSNSKRWQANGGP